MSMSIGREWSESNKLAALDKIGLEKLGYVLKDWQRSGTAKLLNGQDLLLLVATGAGKSLLFYLYALARPQEIVIVVSPLKMLEKNMAESIKRKGITTTGLNADVIASARREGRDIWAECCAGLHQIILCSPEQLASPEMTDLLAHPLFKERVGLVAIDEVHLVPIWGGHATGHAFRRAFNAIGNVRSSLGSNTVFFGTTATLMDGEPLDVVKEKLGFNGLKFSFMRLDCERKNLHIILRRIEHAFNNGVFSDLDWLLPVESSLEAPTSLEIVKTIVYVDNILLGHKLVLYLRAILPPPLKSRSNHSIRHLHASTCPDCKDEVLEGFSSKRSSELRIVVATEAFGCGIDIPDIQRVVIFGTPQNLDSAYQRLGRAARGIPEGWGYIYINPRLWDTIKRRVEPTHSAMKRLKQDGSTATEDETKCCQYIEQLLVAHLSHRCLSECINRLYSNPTNDSECTRCSGCITDNPPQPTKTPAPPKQTATSLSFPAAANRGPGRTSKEMSAKARRNLEQITMDTWLSMPVNEEAQFEGADSLLSPEQSTLVIKHLRDLETEALVRSVLGDEWMFWDSHGTQLVAAILGLRNELIEELKAKQATDQAKREADRLAALVGSDMEYESDLEKGCEGEGLPDVEMQETRPRDSGRELVGEAVQPRLMIRIPPAAWRKRPAEDTDI